MPIRGDLPIYPSLYHIHNSRDADDLPYWFELAAEQGGPVLELGCGTGRVLLPLAEAGYWVYGLDNDADMLDFFSGQIGPEAREYVSLIQADLCRYRLDLKFPLIILPCNTFTTLDSEQRRQALALVRRHLRPGGIFSTSVPNPDYLLSLPKSAPQEIEDAFPHPLDGEPVQVSSAWKRTSSQFVITWTYDHLLPDGRVERFSRLVRQNLLTVPEIIEEFRSADLQVREVYGDFDRSPRDEDSLYLILTAVPDVPR